MARLLENVTYQSRLPEKVTTLMGNEITCESTFPYNSESKTAGKTAHNWAEWSQCNKKVTVTPEPITLDNDPFEIKIIDFESRAEGGRAYKVIDNKNRLFDLREDQVIEIIRTCGIQKGGSIPGKFQWGVNGSQMKLVLVGGKLHKEMKAGLEAKLHAKEARSNGTSFSPTRCNPGHVYSRGLAAFIYVGRLMHAGAKQPKYVLINLWNGDGYEPYWSMENRNHNTNLPDWNSLSFKDRINEFLLHYKSRGHIDNLKQNSFKAFEKEIDVIDNTSLEFIKRKTGSLEFWHYQRDWAAIKPEPVMVNAHNYNCSNKEFDAHRKAKKLWDEEGAKWLNDSITWID